MRAVIRTLAWAGLGLAAMVAPSIAADVNDPYAYNPATAAPSVAANWTGFYAGAHAGYGWAGNGGLDADGFAGGIQGGYNWQSGQIMLGGEADLSYADIGFKGFADRYDMRWKGSVRGRIGFVFDRFVAYGTGGVSWANAKYRLNAVGSDSQTHWGWTLGAGVEALITDRWTARLEYLYENFDSRTYAVGPGFNLDPTINTVRIGMNYRF